MHEVVEVLAGDDLEHPAEQDVARVAVVEPLARTPDALMVIVRDTGIGLPDTIAPNLGLEIAEALVAGDLHGELQFNRPETGTEITIRLPRAAERPNDLPSE